MSTVLAFLGTVAVALGALSRANDQQPGEISGEGVTRWLENSSYERLEYGREGDLRIHQMIRFGGMVAQESGCRIPVRVTSFDSVDQSHVKKTTDLSLFVDCASPHLAATIAKLLRKSGDQHLEAKVTGDELVYPETPQDGMRLPDLHYSLKLKRGFLAAIGTKVTANVTDRNVGTLPARAANGNKKLTYEIHSEVRIRMYAIGLRIRTSRFSSRLVIDPIRGPIEETLDHDDGGRTLIRLVSPAEHPE